MTTELLSTKHLGGTAFNLLFQINDLGENKHVDGQIFDVHGLAQMKFLIRNTTDSEAEILLSVMKHDLTMSVDVNMKVITEDPKFENTFTLAETWSQYSTLFILSYTNQFRFDIEVDIKVGSRKAVLDIMYVDEDFTDFQFSTADGSVPVHRACIASHSVVFRRMLCGEWKETAAGRIEIEGVTLKTLKDLKRYMYLGTLPEDGLCSLLRIAAYYLIDDLKTECTIQLAHSVTSENLYELLEFSYAYNIPELTFAILRAVRANPRDLIEVAHLKMNKTRPKKETGDVKEKDVAVQVAVDKESESEDDE